MRRARILFHGKPAGVLEERENGRYRFIYLEEYQGEPVSFSMPTDKRVYEFDSFPPACFPKAFSLMRFSKDTKSTKTITSRSSSRLVRISSAL